MRLFFRAAGELGRAEMSGSGERLAVSTDSRASPVDGELWAAQTTLQLYMSGEV